MSSEEPAGRRQNAGSRSADESESVQLDASLPDDEEWTPVDVEHEPPRTSQIAATVLALFGAAMTAPFATLAIPFGLSGFALVAAGMFYAQSRAWLSVGTGLVLIGALITGAYGALSPELMLIGIGAAILAWDVGQQGLVIADQLGRKTRSQRTLLAHTALSAIVVGLVSAVAYVSFTFAGDGRPAAAVATVVLGVTLAAWVFRN